MPGKFPQGVFESINEALGSEDNRIGGSLYTFLNATLSPTSTAISVDSTYLFPDSGSVKIGGEVIQYISKGVGTLTASRRAKDAVSQPVGRVCYDATGTTSEIGSLRKQVFLDTADGIYLQRALSNYGLNHITGISDPTQRAYGKYAAFPVAGRMRTVAEVLGKVLLGQLRYALISSSGALTLIGNDPNGNPSRWPAINGRLVRIIAGTDAGLYRVKNVTSGSATAQIDPAPGTYYDGKSSFTVGAVAVEIVTWDVWEDPTPLVNQCRFHIDTLTLAAFSGLGIKGSAYLQAGELRTSTTTTAVSTVYDITQVLGVFLSTDVERAGTNYFTGGSFVGKNITLGSALPGATTAVIVDYGAAQYTAQAMGNASVSGDIPHTHYPFYLSDPGSFAQPVVDVIRAAGMLPVWTNYVV